MSAEPRLPSRPLELTTIGAALKEERLKLGMTQIQVADQFGISLKVLRNLEQGRGGVSLAVVSQILEMFGKEIRVGDILVSPTRSPGTRPRREKVLESLKLIKPVLEKKFNIKKAALFGSCARDEAKKDSDIDLAVEFTQPINFTTLGKITVFLETIFEGHKVDLVEFSKMTPEVRKTAKKDYIYV